MLPWIIAGGFALYALMKEGEVAEKNQQIEKLQEDNLKLKENVKKLQEGFKELLCKYESLKIWTFKYLILKSDTEDKLFKLWLLDDYLALSIKRIRNEALSPDEARFLDIIGEAIEPMNRDSRDVVLSEEDRDFIRKFVNSRHEVKIIAGEEPNLAKRLQEIEEGIRGSYNEGNDS